MVRGDLLDGEHLRRDLRDVRRRHGDTQVYFYQVEVSARILRWTCLGVEGTARASVAGPE